MTAPGLGAHAVVLAHHPVVEALPAVVPMVLLVGAFAGIVVADRRRSRHEDPQHEGPEHEGPEHEDPEPAGAEAAETAQGRHHQAR